MYERGNILRIFKETREAVSEDNVAKIKSLSDQTTNSASLTHDPDNIASAVVIYSLSKILERQDYRKMDGWKNFYEIYLQSIEGIISALEKENDNSFRNEISKIRKAIEKLSGKLGDNIRDVFRNASINKASRIYEHGISMERTSNLLGISLFELAEYAGEKKGADIPESVTVSPRQRIKFAMEMFE